MKRSLGYTYIAPLLAWLIIFFLLPLLIITSYSFMQRGVYGGVLPAFSLDAYISLCRPELFKVFFNTIIMSVISTTLIIGLALPTAFFIARSRHRNILLFLIIIPFWTNFLIRIYAWIAILGNNGILNQTLISLGLIKESIQFMYNPYAVVLVMTYTYLPFAILPLYSTIEKFDFSLLEAARDLGATKAQSMLKVLLPNIRTGVFSAVLFTFIPAFGAYAVPHLVGDANSYMLGNIIAKELTITRNWPLAAAISTLLTLLTIAAVYLSITDKKQQRQVNDEKA